MNEKQTDKLNENMGLAIRVLRCALLSDMHFMCRAAYMAGVLRGARRTSRSADEKEWEKYWQAINGCSGKGSPAWLSVIAAIPGEWSDVDFLLAMWGRYRTCELPVGTIINAK